MHPLSKRLRSLGDTHQFHATPLRPPQELVALEKAIGERFPDDFRAVMLEVGAFQVRGPRIWLVLELVNDLLLMVHDHDDDMPGILMIGSDNGDYGYYYDLKGRLGHGAFAIYFVDRGTSTFERSHFVAATLTEALEQVLAGENFRDRPYVGT